MPQMSTLRQHGFASETIRATNGGEPTAKAPEETIAIGDNSNDVSIIRTAGLGCAVAVAEVIEKFVLGR